MVVHRVKGMYIPLLTVSIMVGMRLYTIQLRVSNLTSFIFNMSLDFIGLPTIVLEVSSGPCFVGK
jgi:hypothetical protein